MRLNAKAEQQQRERERARNALQRRFLLVGLGVDLRSSLYQKACSIQCSLKKSERSYSDEGGRND
jgi:hypothetical protein